MPRVARPTRQQLRQFGLLTREKSGDPLMRRTLPGAGVFPANALACIIPANVTLTDGVNDNVGPLTSSFTRIVGPTMAFTITSVSPVLPGNYVILYNTTTENMTIEDEAGTGAAVNRIHTSTGSDLVTVGEGYVILIYDGLIDRWRDIGFSV